MAIRASSRSTGFVQNQGPERVILQKDTSMLISENENIYNKIPRQIFDNLIRERDINVTGNFNEKSRQLFEYDKIMPEWILNIMSYTLDTFHKLNINAMYVFGALNGIDYVTEGLNHRMSISDHVPFIKVKIMARDPARNRVALGNLVGSMKRHLLEKCAEYLRLPQSYLKFIESDQLQYAVINNTIQHINVRQIEQMAQRYDKLLQHKYTHILSALYEIDNHEEWMNVVRRPPHPMESIIINFDSFRISEIINLLGIVVPQSFSSNITQYVKDNIVAYSTVLARNGTQIIPVEDLCRYPTHEIYRYISRLTDMEIFNNIGVYVAYSGRDELVNNMVRVIREHNFMTPVHRIPSRSVNKTTIMGAEITDPNIFMVCYGNPAKYYVYELDDLAGAFYRDRETGIMEFRHPENTNLVFSLSEIEFLERLLRCYDGTDQILQLIQIINDGIADHRDKIAHDDEARRQLQKFNTTEKDLLQQFLKQLFYTGMYMRRWDGPGHPYPLLEKDTKNKPEPTDTITHQLGIGGELLKSMTPPLRNFCHNLKVCEYKPTGNIEIAKFNLKHEWDQIMMGNQCIRVASSRFVGTGFHYLRSLFRITIPGMNIKTLDRIF